MKSKDKCSSKTSNLLKEIMQEETKKALKHIHEIAEEVRKQKKTKLAG